MIIIYLAFVLVGTCCTASNFYSGYNNFPVFQQYYTPAPPPQLYYQPYTTTHFYNKPTYTHYVPAQVQAQESYVEPESNNVQNEPAVEINRRSNVNVESDFRGFAYHNQFEGGARSDVIFVTGPEIHKLNSNAKLGFSSVTSRTSASDAIDSNAVVVEAARNAENPMFRSIINFFENPQSGVQKFYLVNNEIVARNVQDEMAVQVNRLERLPVSPIFPILKERFGSYGEEKIVEAESEIKTEKVPAASTTTTEQPKTTTVAPTTTESPKTTSEAPKSTTMGVIVVEAN